MTEKWAKDFMQALKQKVETHVDEVTAEQDANTGLWYLRCFLPVAEELDLNVLMQTLLFEASMYGPQVEILFILTNEVQEGTEDELEMAAAELNYISNVGAFGLRRNLHRFYLRDCLPIMWEDDIDALAEKVDTYYSMMIETLRGGYAGLLKIWTGESTFEAAVEEGLLNRAPELT